MIPSYLIEWNGTLEVLNPGTNNLTGNIERAFPSNCDLKTLDLRENLLEGKIPKSLANLTMLQVLNLGTTG